MQRAPLYPRRPDASDALFRDGRSKVLLRSSGCRNITESPGSKIKLKIETKRDNCISKRLSSLNAIPIGFTPQRNESRVPKSLITQKDFVKQ